VNVRRTLAGVNATSVSRSPARRAAWLRRSGADALLAVAVALVQVAGTYAAASHQPERRPLDVLGVVLLAAGPMALGARRRHPVAVLGVAFATTLVYALADYPGGPIWVALIVAFFTTLTTGHRVAGLASIGVGYPVFLWLDAALGRGPAPSLSEVVGNAAWMLVLVAGAEIVRIRRAYVGEVRHRAQEAEHTREEEARRRQSEERLQIARELHDVLAHNISLMNVQASTALHLLDERPEQARPALTAIKQASSDALGELRSVLDALRQSGEAPPRTPAPSLSRLYDLTAQAAAAGLGVETIVDGVPRPLPASVELAAFRICQEAVTNVVRHAGTASARIRLAYGDDELLVQVDDDGRGAASNGTGVGGRGLTGMRERATALGGSLEAGPGPGGGFHVRARLPTDGAP
jgi:signal transduction histidine kinase